eukprot:TRINITY_DN3645_c0_g5_i2.p1 TRINITY_DN3645_c0_g5~~TRINITY_DN3645_c0_g5_i2.p1  ORF type:complete len:1404 (+),score=371.02 TRINITY_DN3645_c0_g5_i2:56-4267(+)
MNSILSDLMCPITLEVLDDPVSVPCCGKAFSRRGLMEHLTVRRGEGRCPACNADIDDFDVENAARNVVLASLVDQVVSGQHGAARTHPPSTSTPPKDHFEATVMKLRSAPIGLLHTTLSNTTFEPSPSLFIAVVDKSGSMAGRPWSQVQAALYHIIAVSSTSKVVTTEIIAYDSTATTLTGHLESTVRNLRAGGGTYFQNAFNEVKAVLERNVGSDLGSVELVFLTDGQASGGSAGLAEMFKTNIQDSWVKRWQRLGRPSPPVTVHSVGFSGGCDRAFLEDLRHAGTAPGTFRYTEPSEAEDALCNKLQSLFELSSKGSTIAIKLTAALPLLSSSYDPLTSTLAAQLTVDSSGYGEHKEWLDLNALETCPPTVTVHCPLLGDTTIPLTVLDVPEEDEKAILVKWHAKSVDAIATELLALAESTGKHPKVVNLHLCLLQQRLASLEGLVAEGSRDTIVKLLEQIKSMKKGKAANLGLIGDARFGSQFNTVVKSKKAAQAPPDRRDQEVVVMEPERVTVRVKECPVRYTFNNTGKERNEVQEACMCDNPTEYGVPFAVSEVALSDCEHTDNDGNSLLHLLAYSGQCRAMETLLGHFVLDLEAENDNGETPATLAVKGRGFWKSLKVLLKHGATIPAGRANGLKEFAVDRGYTATAAILDESGADFSKVDSQMTPDFIAFQYDSAAGAGIEIDAQNYLSVCLEKQMHRHVRMLLKDDGAKPDIDMLLAHCIPRKPDDPETSKYLDLCKLLVNNSPELCNEVNTDGEGPLFKSAEKGSLPHVKYFLGRGCGVDEVNHLGNTPLWISTNKVYPCIMEALLDAGADPNKTNLKGNPPLYSVCQRGPKKVAEMLLARGASVDHFNTNGDTLILLCCRNGQHEILEMFLNLAEESIVRHKAEIDGFDAMLASTEADKPLCIKTLHEYDFALEDKTEATNAILPSATPLHLAAYYNRIAAAEMLLSLGANPNSRDAEDRTPLHVAVLQGNLSLIRLLVANGGDPTLMDSTNTTATGYSRGKEDIQDVITDPLLNALMDLAKGGFGEAEKEACGVLAANTGVVGGRTPQSCIDVKSNDGSTALAAAVINGRVNVVRTLVQMGADPSLKSCIGLDAAFWAQWNRNAKIKTLVKDVTPLLTRNAVARLEAASKMSSLAAQILYTASPPHNPPPMPPTSGIVHRMSARINDVKTGCGALLGDNDDASVAFAKLLNSEEMSGRLWGAKVYTAGLVGSGVTELSPLQVIALVLMTTGTELYDAVNKQLPCPVGNLVGGAMGRLQPCTQEFFLGVEGVDRSLFLPGADVCWTAFMSGSSLWRVAIDHLQDFTTKKKEGTVFIIKSKHAKFLSLHSPYSMDGEVALPPGVQLKVRSWYRGDTICLGQANIRTHTFGLNTTSDVRNYLGNHKSLIIELSDA